MPWEVTTCSSFSEVNMVSSTLVLSLKASIKHCGSYIEVRKLTSKMGMRTVKVPTNLVQWTVDNRTLLNNCIPTVDRSFSFDTPSPPWKVTKTFFEGDQEIYLSYSKFDPRGTRIW